MPEVAGAGFGDGAAAPADDAGGECMKREQAPVPAVPTNAAEAPDDADWSIASSKKSAAQQASTPAEALDLYTEALHAEAATACLSAPTLAQAFADVSLKNAATCPGEGGRPIRSK